MTPPELRALLGDSLALWGVPGRVVVDQDDVTLGGIRVREAAASDAPVRWWIERDGRRRPCTGMLGLLRALRNAVGAGEGSAARLRVATPPA